MYTVIVEEVMIRRTVIQVDTLSPSVATSTVRKQLEESGSTLFDGVEVAEVKRRIHRLFNENPNNR